MTPESNHVAPIKTQEFLQLLAWFFIFPTLIDDQIESSRKFRKLVVKEGFVLYLNYRILNDI